MTAEERMKEATHLAAQVMQVHAEWLADQMTEAPGRAGEIADESRPAMERIVTKAIELAMRSGAAAERVECMIFVRNFVDSQEFEFARDPADLVDRIARGLETRQV